MGGERKKERRQIAELNGSSYRAVSPFLRLCCTFYSSSKQKLNYPGFVGTKAWYEFISMGLGIQDLHLWVLRHPQGTWSASICLMVSSQELWCGRPTTWILSFPPIFFLRKLMGIEYSFSRIKKVVAIYYHIATTDEAIAGASVLDNGNFVVYGHNGGVIWQSFDSPTDILLPGQHLPSGQKLVSRASQMDLGRGKFRLKMQTDGNLVQYPVSSHSDTAENAYYSSGTYGDGKNLSLNLENDGRLNVYNGAVSYNITTGWKPKAGSMYMVIVDMDGIFRIYNRLLDPVGNWTVIWSSTEDRCVPKGICGLNSFCTYQDQVVTCTCLPGFGDGCKQNFDIGDCRNKDPSVRCEMRKMASVTWEDNHYAVEDTEGEEDCGDACVSDCDCVLALFKDGKCRKQRLLILYGIRIRERANKTGRSHVPWYVIIGASIGTSALAISSIIVYYLIKRGGFYGQDEESRQNVNKVVINHGSLALKRYSYKDIRKITKSFTEKLGQGGYGIVYKGKLPDGQLVAVKVLTRAHDKADEFLNEVASISRTSHVNIVNLLGFCIERRKRALVYEFMPNKSLDKYICKRGSAIAECSLEWNKLYEIAGGVARGLEYLHRGCNTRIVHFDIKPQNILLDQQFRPKIADFGLAKLCVKTQSAISMLGTRGTIGYISPEVFSRKFGVVSHKSDAYSYGIMLLQMARARINVEIKSFRSSEDYFLENMYKHTLVQNEKVYCEIREGEEEVVRKMLMVGYWCIQTAPSDRPLMNNVVEMLVGNLQLIQLPPLPCLLSSLKPESSCSQLPVIVETRSSKMEFGILTM